MYVYSYINMSIIPLVLVMNAERIEVSMTCHKKTIELLRKLNHPTSCRGKFLIGTEDLNLEFKHLAPLDKVAIKKK